MNVGTLRELLSKYEDNVNIDLILNDDFSTYNAGAEIVPYNGAGCQKDYLGMQHRDINGNVSNVNMTIRISKLDGKLAKLTFRK